MCLVALLCTFSKASMWFSWYGHHKHEQYSGDDLTAAFCLGTVSYTESSTQ